MSSNISTRCAACKCLRRKCPEDCVLAPYFPSSKPQRFASVHKIFGASNVTKMLQQLPLHLRAVAADCMSFEATSRIEDPIYGCAGIISQLHRQIMEAEFDIIKIKGQIAFCSAQRQQQQQQMAQTQTSSCIMYQEQQQAQGEASWLWSSSSQQEIFHFDPQSQFTDSL